MLKRLKNAVNKYMANIRPDRLMTCLSERKSVISRPSVYIRVFLYHVQSAENEINNIRKIQLFRGYSCCLW
jgi:hypothetical protein